MLNRKRHLRITPAEDLQQKQDDTSDAALAALAAGGNRWAAEHLVRRYQDRAFAVAFRMSDGDEEQARDATQDAFVKALARIDRFRGESSFYTWFYRILVNTCLDARNRGKRWSRLFPFSRGRGGEKGSLGSIAERAADPVAGSNPLEMLEGRQLESELARVLKGLPDRQRTVFELKVFEEMKLSEIAQVMKLETGTVKSHLFRATKAVRRALAHWAGE